MHTGNCRTKDYLCLRTELLILQFSPSPEQDFHRGIQEEGQAAAVQTD